MMKNANSILLFLFMAVACSKVVPYSGPEPTSDPEPDPIPERFEPEISDSKPDTLISVCLTPALWDSLDIFSHPWINEADYDHNSSKWIIHDGAPEKVSFSYSLPFYHNTNGKMTDGKGNNYSWSCLLNQSLFVISSPISQFFGITVIGKDFFILSSSHVSRVFSYEEAVDTSRVVVLDTTDQITDPDATYDPEQ